MGRLILGVLGLASWAMVLGGISVLVAALPLLGMAAAGGVAAAGGRAALVMASVFLLGGLGARVLVRSTVGLLSAERDTGEPHRTGSASWLAILAVALVVMPAVMLVRLGPLAALWTEAFALMEDAKVWDVVRDGAPGLSGIVLLPIAAALAVPALACAAAGAFVGGSMASLVLLPAHRPSFPRIYAITIVLQAALVIATLYGGSLTRQAADLLEREIQQHGDSRTQAESAAFAGHIERYNIVIASSSLTLGWTLCAYAIWLVPLLARSPGRGDARAHRATAWDGTGRET